jgi:hypothetical protein
VRTQAAREDWSKERSLELLGPEVMADIAASVAAAPPPSPELIAKLRRLFAAVQIPQHIS